MPRSYDLYAKIEVQFVRGEKWFSLPPGARCLYISLWCYALEKRKQIIPRPTDVYLSSMARLPHHPIASYLRLLHVLGLCVVNDDTIEMVGLRAKHPKLLIKDTPNGGDTGEVCTLKNKNRGILHYTNTYTTHISPNGGDKASLSKKQNTEKSNFDFYPKFVHQKHLENISEMDEILAERRLEKTEWNIFRFSAYSLFWEKFEKNGIDQKIMQKLVKELCPLLVKKFSDVYVWAAKMAKAGKNGAYERDDILVALLWQERTVGDIPLDSFWAYATEFLHTHFDPIITQKGGEKSPNDQALEEILQNGNTDGE